jgi:hypothetical protein
MRMVRDFILSLYHRNKEGYVYTGKPVRLVETATFANLKEKEQKLDLPITAGF